MEDSKGLQKCDLFTPYRVTFSNRSNDYSHDIIFKHTNGEMAHYYRDYISNSRYWNVDRGIQHYRKIL